MEALQQLHVTPGNLDLYAVYESYCSFPSSLITINYYNSLNEGKRMFNLYFVKYDGSGWISVLMIEKMKRIEKSNILLTVFPSAWFAGRSHVCCAASSAVNELFPLRSASAHQELQSVPQQQAGRCPGTYL